MLLRPVSRRSLEEPLHQCLQPPKLLASRGTVSCSAWMDFGGAGLWDWGRFAHPGEPFDGLR